MRRPLCLALAVLLLLGCSRRAAPPQAPAQPSSPPPAALPPAAPNDTAGVARDQVVVGTWVSGRGGALSGMEAHIRQVNEAGGVHGRQIKLLVEEDKGDPRAAPALVQKLVEKDKVFAIVGGASTQGTRQVLTYLRSSGVPHVAPLDASGLWTMPPDRHTFGFLLPRVLEARLLTQHAVGALRLQQVAVVYPDDDFGREGLEGVRIQLRKYSLAPAIEVGIPPGETDVAPYVVRLKGSGAQAVILWLEKEAALAILKEAQANKYSPRWLGPSLLIDAELAGTGLIATRWLPPHTDASDPRVQPFLSALRKHFPDEKPSQAALAGWGAAEILVEGLRRTGKDLSRERFISALEELKAWGGSVAPSLTYGPNDRRGISAAWFVEAREGAFRPAGETARIVD